MARPQTSLGLLPIEIVLSALLFSSTAFADLFQSAVSPVIQDGLINAAPTTCPVAQDGYTYNTFPWTHNPTCADVVLPAVEGDGIGVHQTFCAYTNVNYNNGRGVSFVVSPEVAASVTFETYGMAVGGLEGQIGEEMGMWEVKDTKDRGKGLFAKKDIGAIFAGESLIIKTPVLFVTRQLLDTPSTTRRELVLRTAVEQLPRKTEKMVKELAKSWGGSDAFDVVKTNGVEVQWPWVDDMPKFLAITPEVARINHACRPNALWRFNDYTLEFDVFALKELKPGDEIVLSYGYEMRSHGRRTRSIHANHNFTCLCSLCTANEEEISASNDRLSEIKAMKSVLPTDPADSPQLLGLLPNLIKLYDEEDLHPERPMYEEILAYTYSSFGILDRAKHWAGRASRHWAILAGKESWEARRCSDMEKDVKAHATWKSWEGEDPWEGVGKGHPWDDHGDDHDHDHDHDHAGSEEGRHAHQAEDGEDLSEYDQRPAMDQFRGHT